MRCDVPLKDSSESGFGSKLRGRVLWMFGSASESCFWFLRVPVVRGWFVNDIRGSQSCSQGLLKGPSGFGRELEVRVWLPGCARTWTLPALKGPSGSGRTVTVHEGVRRLESVQMESVLLWKRAKDRRGCRFVSLR